MPGSMAEPPSTPDLPGRLRRWTQARVGLGRAGQALPTSALLDFELAHARARDAVVAQMDAASLAGAVGGEAIEVSSQAPDQRTYLQRPDLGRLLNEDDETRLKPGHYDAALIIADGLSATAVHHHAVPLLRAIMQRLSGWALAPIVIARHARVALSDEIGATLGADLAVILIGERPGLSAPDSLGAYLTWAPRRGRRDSERNCVSNIRPPHGLGYPEAADRIARLMKQARVRRQTGVDLKDEARTLSPPPL